MTVFPRHTASARLTLPVAAVSPTRAAVARVALAAALVLAAPATALAGGGVSIASTPAKTATSKSTTTKSTTTKAKAASIDDPAIDASDAPAVDPAVKPRSVSKTQVRRAQTLLRVSATGTNDTATRKVVKRFQVLRGLAPYGIIDLTTYVQIKDAFALLETGGAGVNIAVDPATAAGGASVAATTPAAPAIVLPPNLAPITPAEQAILDKIAQCESQGNPTAVSADGTYRGKYQFDRSTWKTVGGTGDPAAASALEQDQRAAILLRQRGTAPWPVCAL